MICHLSKTSIPYYRSQHTTPNRDDIGYLLMF